MYYCRDTCSTVFTVALFLMGALNSLYVYQLLTSGKKDTENVYIYTMEYYLPVKNRIINEI